MTTKSMSAGQIQRFIRMCEDQGVVVTRTKKGLFIRFPDGSSTVQHFTNSDTRAVQNQISRFRRAGVVHPDDPRGPSSDLPTYITNGQISVKSRTRMIEYVVEKGYPDVLFSPTVVKDLKMDPTQVNRLLYHTGFRPGNAVNRKSGRPWYTPADLLELKDKGPSVQHDPDAALMAVADRARRAQEVVNDMGLGERKPVPVSPHPDAKVHQEAIVEAEKIIDAAVKHEEAIETEEVQPYVNPGTKVRDILEPETVEKIEAEPVKVVESVPRETAEPKEREFIDTEDSWLVDLKQLLGPSYVYVEDRLKPLEILGLEYEFRVWRKRA